MKIISPYTLLFLLAAAGTVHAASALNTPLTAVAPQSGKKMTIRALPAGPCAIGDTLCALKAVVTDETNTPLSGVTVNFYLKGSKIDSQTTKADGSAIALHVIPYGELAVGSNSYEARIGSENNVMTAIRPPVPGSQSTSTGTITVVKGGCRISFLEATQKPQPPGPDSNTLFIRGMLGTTQPGSVGGSRTVNIAFAGRSYEVITDKGSISRTIPLSLADLSAYQTSQVTGSYAGDDQVLSCSGSKQVKLQGVLPKAWGYSVYGDPTPSPSVRLGETVRVKVHFHSLDPPYAPVAAMPFVVTAYNYTKTLHLGSGVTDAQGNGTIYYHHTTPVEPAGYTMQIRYNNNGQEYVNYAAPVPGDAREILNVIPTEVDAEVTAPATAAALEPVTVTVRVTRRSDHAPVAMQMALKRDDGIVNAIVQTSDSQGNATFTFKMSPAKDGITHYGYTVQDSTPGKTYTGFKKNFSIAYPTRSSSTGTQLQLQ